MASILYEYIFSDEVAYARSQLEFYEHKLSQIENSECNESNREIRRMRVNFLIYCIKYAYGL